MKDFHPLSRQKDLVTQETEDGFLIYDVISGKTFFLNETATLIWKLCDGTRSISDLSSEISKQFAKNSTDDLVWFTLQKLKTEKLISNSKELPTFFAGMSRREVIKKVGLGTMIALPLISSLVAPTSVQANSCLGNRPQGAACTRSCDCAVLSTTGFTGPGETGPILAIFSGRCCRSSSGPYGAMNTCVPGNSSVPVAIPRGYYTHIMGNAGPGTLNCFNP